MQRREKLFQILTVSVIVITIIFVISSLTGAASNNSTNGPIGYVNSERLQEELPDFKKLESIYKDKKTEFDSYQGYLYQSHRNNVKQLQDKATQDKNGKSADEQASIDKKLQDEIQKKTEELKAQLDQKYNEIQKYLNEQKKVVIDKQTKLIADVATEQKIGMVLEKSVILFGGTDITQAVIDKAGKEQAKDTKK
jgi:Skp family chaperone for outer membrane proteins